jgi:hypothetical protein
MCIAMHVFKLKHVDTCIHLGTGVSYSHSFAILFILLLKLRYVLGVLVKLVKL